VHIHRSCSYYRARLVLFSAVLESFGLSLNDTGDRVIALRTKGQYTTAWPGARVTGQMKSVHDEPRCRDCHGNRDRHSKYWPRAMIPLPAGDAGAPHCVQLPTFVVIRGNRYRSCVGKGQAAVIHRGCAVTPQTGIPSIGDARGILRVSCRTVPACQTC
jgi:hypothetical protein